MSPILYQNTGGPRPAGALQLVESTGIGSAAASRSLRDAGRRPTCAWKALRRSSSGRDDRRHPFAFHRGVFLDLADLFEGTQHFFHDLATLVDMGQLAATEQDIDQHLVLRFEELAGTLDLDLDVVVAGLGPDPDFLDVDLVLLLLGELFLLRVLELAEVDDFADGRPLVGATSTRSSPASRAASRALLVGMTPSMTPSALMTRTGEMRICSFTLIPRSIGPIASSSGTDKLGSTRLRREPAVNARSAQGRLSRTTPRSCPGGSSSVVASQIYPLRFHHRVVKILCHRLNCIIGASCPQFIRDHSAVSLSMRSREDALAPAMAAE